MAKVMGRIECALGFAKRCAAKVVANADFQKKATWVGEVDIGTFAKIIAVKSNGLSVQAVAQQEEELKQQIAEFIATKIFVDLLDNDITNRY